MNTTQLANVTGLTRRQIDHWIEKGWFFPEQENHEHEWPPKEVHILQKTAVLVRIGWGARLASWYARTEPEMVDEILIAVGRRPLSPPAEDW